MKTIPLDEARQEDGGNLVYRRFDTIQAEPIKWLWESRIARGKFSMIAGDPGLGKSQLTAFMASVVTNGGKWPVDGTSCPKGSVIFLSAEDDAADTIRPRIEAVGADLSKVYILDAVRDEDEDGNPSERSFNLKRDLMRLGELMEKIADVALVIIDPISAYLGGTDSHKNSDIRALLAPLSDLASKYKAAFIGVSHLNKGQAKQALQRVTGSLAFVAAARAAFIVAKDNDTPERRMLLPIKNNIGDDHTGFAFSIQSIGLPGGIQTSRIEFENELITERADDILSDDKSSEEQSSLDSAVEFLREFCVITRTAKYVYAQADEAGFSKTTIRRAQQALKIKPVKDGNSGPWVWRLPEDAQETEDAHQNNVSTFEIQM
jgi:putative DNA primase/helicase